MTHDARVDISVVLCAYTEERWHDLLHAVESIKRQNVQPKELIVVIDHNPELLARTRREITDVIVVENRETRGLSGARNSGIAVAQGAIIAFMDEDALAAPDWLAQLWAAYDADQPHHGALVLGVGGAIEPMWQDARPGWFPEEFDWVVGCTYRGMPQVRARVRNLIGCNMSFRRDVFEQIGGFRNGIGRVGTRPVGCEETELCIRASQHWPAGIFLYEPRAQVHHRVPTKRSNFGYFRARCYAEGQSKALVSQLVGAGDGLASERAYTFSTLPLGVARGVRETFLSGDAMGLARGAAIVAGLGFTTAGYLTGTLSERWGASDSSPQLPDGSTFQPIRILQVEIGQPLPDISAFDEQSGKKYQRALSLVRLHNQPLGVIELTLNDNDNGLSAAEYASQIWQALSSEINAHLQEDGLPAISQLSASGLPMVERPTCQQRRARLLANAPFVSVVIATRNRADKLAICLDSLLALEYTNYEIIVVDNAPSDEATADLIKQQYGDVPQIRYVREDRPGLAVAHNRGLMEVDINTPIVAFTDDDVIVDRYWLTELVKNFAQSGHKQVGCVTGMIFPAELETPAQVWIEQYGGFGKGFSRQVFDLHENRPESHLYPYTAGKFGSGANMAFSSSFLRAIGGFDAALGAGSVALGGDDLAAFFQVITEGYTLVYEPGAIVHHWHRRDYEGLRRQAYGYGVGLTAYLMKTLVDKPTRFLSFALKIPSGVVYALSPHSAKNAKKQADYPSELSKLERKGMLYGPFAYLRSRFRF